MTDGNAADAAIAQAWGSGAEDALERAYQRWSPLVHGLARRAVGPTDAEDVTQQVFLAAWRRRETYDSTQGPLGAWLVGITRRAVADSLRQRHRAEEVPSTLEDGTADEGWHDVDRDDLLHTAPQQDVGESPRRGAGVEAPPSFDDEAERLEGLECAQQLVGAPGRVPRVVLDVADAREGYAPVAADHHVAGEVDVLAGVRPEAAVRSRAAR